jgi:hypothetical protein
MKFKLKTTEKKYYYQMRNWLRQWNHSFSTKEEVDSRNKVRSGLSLPEFRHPSKRGKFTLIGFNEQYTSGPKKFQWKIPYIEFNDDGDAIWFALTMGELIDETATK